MPHATHPFARCLFHLFFLFPLLMAHIYTLVQPNNFLALLVSIDPSLFTNLSLGPP